MGQEIETHARIDGKRKAGKVQLETDHLLWRGAERLKIPFRSMRSVKARDGALHIKHPEGDLVIDLGARAAKWEDKILHPPSVLDKLGVKKGQRVSILGADDASLVADIEGRTEERPSTRPRKDSDILFLFANDHHDLDRIEKLRRMLRPDGAIWVVYPKGRKEMTENDVIAGGRAAGLKDVKVVRYSDTHTGLKMVIPVSER